MWLISEIQVNQMERSDQVCLEFDVIWDDEWDITTFRSALRGFKVFESVSDVFAVPNLPCNQQGLWNKDVLIMMLKN